MLKILSWVDHIFVKILLRVEISRARGKRYQNIRITHITILTKSRDDLNYFDSNVRKKEFALEMDNVIYEFMMFSLPSQLVLVMDYCLYEYEQCFKTRKRIQNAILILELFFSVEDFCLQNTQTYHQHPTDCTKFIQCEGTTTYGKSCQPGLCFGIFSVSYCDYCTSVVCSRPTSK